MRDRPQRTAWIGGGLVALAAVLFAGVAVVGKVAVNRSLPVVPLLAVRFAVSAAFLLIALLASRRTLVPKRGQRWQTILLGTVYALESGLFFASLRYGTVAALTLLFFTYPAWVALLGVLSQRGRLSRLLLASLIAAIAGAGLVLSDVGSLSLSWLGAGLALGSSLAAAIYIWTADMVLVSTDSFTAAMHVCLGAAVSFLAWELGTGDFPLDSIRSNWLLVISLGLLTGLGFVALLSGLRHLGAMRTSIVAALEPVAVAVLAGVFLGESLGPATATGGVLILTAIVAATQARAPAAPTA